MLRRALPLACAAALAALPLFASPFTLTLMKASAIGAVMTRGGLMIAALARLGPAA